MTMVMSFNVGVTWIGPEGVDYKKVNALKEVCRNRVLLDIPHNFILNERNLDEAARRLRNWYEGYDRAMGSPSGLKKLEVTLFAETHCRGKVVGRVDILKGRAVLPQKP